MGYIWGKRETSAYLDLDELISIFLANALKAVHVVLEFLQLCLFGLQLSFLAGILIQEVRTT